MLATEQWIYADGENAPLEEQNGRLEALKAVGVPIKNRWRFRNEYEDFIIDRCFEADRVNMSMGVGVSEDGDTLTIDVYDDERSIVVGTLATEGSGTYDFVAEICAEPL